MKNIEIMKNITAIEKTAIGKTAIAKITAKITTTALLFFLLLLFYNQTKTTMKTKPIMKTKTTKNSKIALLAIVFFSPVFFSLVGGNNLQVQEQKSLKKTGWFVGVNPFSPSIELETKQSLSATDFSRTTETISGFDFPQVIRILKA